MCWRRRLPWFERPPGESWNSVTTTFRCHSYSSVFVSVFLSLRCSHIRLRDRCIDFWRLYWLVCPAKENDAVIAAEPSIRKNSGHSRLCTYTTIRRWSASVLDRASARQVNVRVEPTGARYVEHAGLRGRKRPTV